MRATLSPAALRAQADTLAHEAYRLRQKAEHLEAAHEQAQRQEEIRTIVRDYIEACDLRTSPEAMAEGLRIELAPLLPWLTAETAAWYLREEFGRSTRHARAMRDREIMRLARLGWCNAEIGHHVGLHPKSISRIVQATLKRWR